MAHWLSDVHVSRQAVPPALQARSPHDIGAGVAQLPAPLQPARAVNVAPAQLADRQVTSSPGDTRFQVLLPLAEPTTPA